MERRIMAREKNFMNTTITIKVVQTDQATIDIQQSIEDAFGEFERIVKKFTRFDENSELSNLNRQGGKWVKVSEEFFWLIEFMLNLSKESDGAFDPTVIDFLELYGYDKKYDFSKLDNPKLKDRILKRALERPSWEEIELDKNDLKVKLAQGQKIDLGGVGKGYAIDCACAKLCIHNENFLIDAGGDIRSRGFNDRNSVWMVDLRSEKKSIGFVELHDEAIASSGSWARKFRQFHHLINPQTGKPLDAEYSTVFVKAKTAIEADGWATAIFINPHIKTKTVTFTIV